MIEDHQSNIMSLEELKQSLAELCGGNFDYPLDRFLTKIYGSRLENAYKAAEDLTAFIKLVCDEEEADDLCYFLRNDMKAPFTLFELKVDLMRISPVLKVDLTRISSVLKDMAQTLEQRVLYIQEKLINHNFRIGESIEKVKERLVKRAEIQAELTTRIEKLREVLKNSPGGNMDGKDTTN